jgi:DNA-binding beta-propeller fold protein YncE
MRARQLSLAVLVALVAGFVLAAGAAAKPTKPTKTPTSSEGESGNPEHVQPPAETSAGALEQLPGRLGCLSSGKASDKLCGKARALKGAGPGVGSRAIAVSPDGRNVYVAASGDDSIAVFDRDRSTGALTQPKGKGGCVAAVVSKAKGCGIAVGLLAPNSVAVSPDGRNVYATTRDGASVVSFLRNPRTGQLRQLPPSSSGCISGLPIPGCTAGRALKWPDVVVVSPDGKNVYVGDFAGSGVISFSRAGKAGALTQLPGTEGCITEAGVEGCAKGVEMNHIEGMAIAANGSAVYTAAAFSSAASYLSRNASTGALTQSGCIVNTAVTGCALGYEFEGVNAFTVAPTGGDVYATSLTSNSLTTFFPVGNGPAISQPPGPEREVEGKMESAAEGTPSPDGCTVYLRSPGCGFGVAMKVPEGLDISPDGANIYVSAFQTGAVDVFDRDAETGVVTQKPGVRGCVAPKKVPGCTRGRALGGTGSIVVSPDGKNVYSTSQFSSAVDVFRRIK